MRFRGGVAKHGRSSDAEAANLVRGASIGFSILLIGGLAAPLASHLPVALIAHYWFTTTAVIAFLAAGLRAGGRGSRGIMAALGAYLLILPLVMTAQGWGDYQQMLETAATAVVIGGGASFIAGRLSPGRKAA
jgi:hypothetical protein